MNTRIAYTILKKELLDTLRDKRTLLMMVGVPILLYPALTLLGFQVAMVHQSKLEADNSRVAIVADQPAPIEMCLSEVEKVTVIDVDDPKTALNELALDAYIVATGDLEQPLSQDDTIDLEIRYDTTEMRSLEALSRLEDAFRDWDWDLLRTRLKRVDLPESFVQPLRIQSINMAPPQKTTGSFLGMLLPLLLIVTIALGAFYPAVDLTAGEKERGTFETLLSTPVSKLEIITGKFLTVFLLSLCTGLLNLISMGLTFSVIFAQLKSTLPAEMEAVFDLPLMVFPALVLTLIPLTLLISAVMISVAVLARSFKEAQNYLTPLFLLLMLPAFASVSPGIRLTPLLQFTPIANVALLFKALMVGQADAEAIFVVILSTSLYAILALWGATWLFQREEIILSEEKGIPITLRRNAFTPRTTLTPGSATALYAFVLLAIFYLGTIAQQRNILLGLIITEWGLIFAPTFFFLWFTRTRIRQSFHLFQASLLEWASVILLSPAVILLTMQIGLWNSKILPLPAGYEEAFGQLFAWGDTNAGLILLLFVVALSPAICEELLFRGALLSSFRRTRLPATVTILLVGLLFGLFHLSIHRLLPTAAMGVMLTWITWRTGSIFPSMLLHALSNSAAILIATRNCPALLNRWLELEHIEENGLPPGILSGALLVMVCGVTLLHYAHKRRK